MDSDQRETEAYNAIAWILLNEIKNENGYPVEFDDHAFLIDPYLDNTPRQAIRKCAQIGWSTLAIFRSFHLAYYAGANIIHTFPSRSISKDFVIPKVNPLIERNRVIKGMVGQDSLSLKQVGDRFIYYRGTYEQTEAISISAHILINDEYDRSNQRVLKTYRSRLDDARRERPELGWEWQFSNPSIPSFGVDVLWQKSDQKHWFVKCSSCNKRQFLIFPENINAKKVTKCCRFCDKELTPDILKKGEWVQKYRNRPISGYWISQLFVPWITAKKIINDSKGDVEIFHNFVLGLPYIDKDLSVTREDILKCVSPGTNSRRDVAIGVDNGVLKHFVVGNKQGIFEIGATKDWQDIEDLRNRFNAVMVIDALPYQKTPMELANKYKGKVFVNYYVGDKRDIETIEWGEGEKRGVVLSHRTKIIDHVVGEINAQDITFNLTVQALDNLNYPNHWQQLYRIVEERPLNSGIMKPVWKRIEGRDDHFAHATVYWRIAMEKALGMSGHSLVRTRPPGVNKRELHPEVKGGKTAGLDIKDVAIRAAKRAFRIKND